LGPRLAAAARRASAARLYWRLSKGKLTVWVSLSALPGYFLALPGAVDPLVLGALAGGTFLTSASAQTMNQLWEIDRDARMSRTANRPLPSGQLTVAEGRCFATACGAIGLGVLAAGATPASAVVAGVTMATYAGLYTPLKVVSPYNTHVGAVSGSLPTLLGFTAACGTGIAVSPWLPHALWLFGMQALWQMPHFYALAWLHRADYIRGGYKMFPITDETGHATAAMSKPYLVALCAMPWGLSACGFASWMLPIGALVPSAIWWKTLRDFEAKPSRGTCRRFFLGSLSYLLAMLGLFAAFARARQAAPGPEGEAPTGAAAAEDQEGGAGKAGCPAMGEPPALLTLEPEWRVRMHAYFMTACPHEQMRHCLFGVGKASCPLSRDDGPA